MRANYTDLRDELKWSSPKQDLTLVAPESFNHHSEDLHQTLPANFHKLRGSLCREFGWCCRIKENDGSEAKTSLFRCKILYVCLCMCGRNK